MILPGARVVQMAWVVDNLEAAAERLSRVDAGRAVPDASSHSAR